ncbi:ribonuclease D [Sphaerospermopsis aphanizomenoides BCCUSP55]|uniref:ribonuclease D n=1 Tax=Sphaerospermopsis aphanizomenoides TaxID=459663 RepID=UPI000ADA1851|nr:ribonuclease D [Sphaerospermopsis aphanizomenoides]MBK1987041.1 ribonuclease D [Sphaerospermopsis aphanizomenoides BCCUSP55]
MPYLTAARDIRSLITKYTNSQTLWIDTEVADFKSRNSRLSLIQILDNPQDMTGDSVYILDVLEQPDVIADFIEQIMMNAAIEKVFHNASYDVKFLGNKKAKNITCTLEMAKSIPYHILPLPNYQLKTLAAVLCNFHSIDKGEQGSDWGQRPLTDEQIEYAYFDCIYLAQIHLQLLALQSKMHTDPATEDLTKLSERYTEVEQQRKLINSEFDYLQERLKKAMQMQNISETEYCKLSGYERKSVKVKFTELMRLVENQDIDLDFPITLTEKLQKELGRNLEQLDVDVEKTSVWRLIAKTQENDASDES